MRDQSGQASTVTLPIRRMTSDPTQLACLYDSSPSRGEFARKHHARRSYAFLAGDLDVLTAAIYEGSTSASASGQSCGPG
ncbi:unnamed protein product [Parajaminaea phylloscopi]